MGTKAAGAEVWSAGNKIIPMTEREGRVAPLAQEWDRVKRLDDCAELRKHIEACYKAECPAMARRAEIKLREVEKCQKMKS